MTGQDRPEGAPDHHLRRIGGNDVEKEERDERDAEEDQEGLAEAAKDVGGHQ